MKRAPRLYIIVITDVSDDAYTDVLLYQNGDVVYCDDLPTTLSYENCQSSRGKMLAFHPGEVIIVDHNYREIGYPQRKPDKYGVWYRTFSMARLRDALSYARHISEEYTIDNASHYHPVPQTTEDWVQQAAREQLQWHNFSKQANNNLIA